MHPIEHLRYIARADGVPQNTVVEETTEALLGFTADPAGLVTACRRIVSRHLSAGAVWNLCAILLCANEPRPAVQEMIDAVRDDASPEAMSAGLGMDASVLTVGWTPLLALVLEQRRDLSVWTADAFGEGESFARALQRYEIEVSEFDPSGVGAMVGAVDAVLLEADAYSDQGAMCGAGSLAAAAVARVAGTPVILLGGEGRCVPPATFAAMAARIAAQDEESGDDPWSRRVDLVGVDLITEVAGPGGVGGVSLLSEYCGPVAPELHKATIN